MKKTTAKTMKKIVREMMDSWRRILDDLKGSLSSPSYLAVAALLDSSDFVKESTLSRHLDISSGRMYLRYVNGLTALLLSRMVRTSPDF